MKAGVLGILFGGLGVHRFYLGYPDIGFLQILVTALTMGWGGLWGFVEGIFAFVRRHEHRFRRATFANLKA